MPASAPRARSAGPLSAGHAQAMPRAGQSRGPSSPDVVLSRDPLWVWQAKPWVWVISQRGQQEDLLKTQRRGRNSASTYSTGPSFAVCRYPAWLYFAAAALVLRAPSSPPRSNAGTGAAQPHPWSLPPHHRLSTDTCSTHHRPGTTGGMEESRRAYGRHLGEITPSGK